MKYTLLIFVLFFAGCFSKNTNYSPNIQLSQNTPAIEQNHILQTGFDMVNSGEIVRGSCWDYIDTLYTRSGYPRNSRTYVFKTSKNRPPFAPLNQIKAGDWLYFINHSYGKVEHSGVFVKWQNRKKGKAVILSYGGENRKKPGRFRVYDINEVFTIIRGV